MTDEYRSRWDVCDNCDVLVIVERDDNRGVPEDMEYRPDCPYCGDSLMFGNADGSTQREAALEQGRRRAWSACAKALEDAADELEATFDASTWPQIYRGTPGWLRDRAAKYADKAAS